MERQMIRHPRLTVGCRTGSEGPQHDPYSYEELTVETPHGKTTLHEGLAVWVKHNGHRLEFYGEKEEVEAWYTFVKLTGYTRAQLERIERKLTERCRKCGSRDTTWMRGLPGEHFEICANCRNMVGSYFCRSEIE